MDGRPGEGKAFHRKKMSYSNNYLLNWNNINNYSSVVRRSSAKLFLKSAIEEKVIVSTIQILKSETMLMNLQKYYILE